MRTALALSVLLLAGCASTQAVTGIVTDDLGAAKANFEVAGMPSEAACMQAVLDRIGQQAAQNFQVKGLISLGSIGYIGYAQLTGSKQTPIPDSCYAIIGKVTTTIGKQGARSFGSPF